MFALVLAKSLLEYGSGILHPITPEYFEHTPPALLAALPTLFSVLMLFLAVRRSTVRDEATRCMVALR